MAFINSDEAAMTLLQKAYRSRLRIAPDRIDHELADILASANRINASNRITGCLGHGANWFFQVLEGEPSIVEETLARISRDARHDEITILAERHVKARSFPEWSMASVELASSSSPYLLALAPNGALNPETITPPQMLIVLMDLADDVRLRDLPRQRPRG